MTGIEVARDIRPKQKNRSPSFEEFIVMMNNFYIDYLQNLTISPSKSKRVIFYGYGPVRSRVSIGNRTSKPI